MIPELSVFAKLQEWSRSFFGGGFRTWRGADFSVPLAEFFVGQHALYRSESNVWDKTKAA